MYLRFVKLVLVRPGLVRHALGAAWAFRARRWYLRPPFLPLPPRSYLRWRMETAYGDPEATPPPEELARFLRWGTEIRKRMRHGR